MSSRAPIRTPAVRTSSTSIRIGWRASADGKPRRHWAAPELYVTCALGPYNFEFMTEVTKEIVSTYKVDGVFSNRWAGHGQCFCEHCRKNFQAFSGMDLPRTNDPRDPARRQYTLWHEQASVRMLEAVGCRDPEDQSEGQLHRELRRRGAVGTRHEDRGRTLPDPVRRPPGTPRRHAALGERQERERISLDHGPQADRRHLQRRRRGAVPLEGLRAVRGRDPRLGGRRHRAGTAAVVHEVQREALRQALDAGGGVDLQLALEEREVPAQRRAAGARRHGVLTADRALLRRRARARPGGGSDQRLLPGAGRRHACHSRWSTTTCSSRRKSTNTGR